MRFRATIQLDGKTATGIRVPDDVVTALGAGKRPPVVVTVNGHVYRSTIAPIGGAYKLPVSAAVREQAGVQAGDEVEVEVAVDTASRDIALPPDLLATLEGDAEALRFFAGLSTSDKRRLVDPIEAAKSAETRQRRIEKAAASLRAGRV